MTKPTMKIKEYPLDEIENLMDRYGIINVSKAIALLDKIHHKSKKAQPILGKHISYSRR